MSAYRKRTLPRLQFSTALSYDIATPDCDFIFNIQAAQTRHQTVLSESLDINQDVRRNTYVDLTTDTRYLRLKAKAGPLNLRYQATVDLHHHTAEPDAISEVPIADLPGHVLPYLYPSRYCQSDQLLRLACIEFGHLRQGYNRVQAIRDWVKQRITFRINSSNSTTSAMDTLANQVGVCRDFAHLMIALCRALNIPARMVTSIDYGADLVLGPTDFHAYVEVFLGFRWYLFDPSGVAIPMGFLRFATGRDAADVAFATMFGTVKGYAPVISIQAVPDAQGVLVVPQHVSYALSSGD